MMQIEIEEGDMQMKLNRASGMYSQFNDVPHEMMDDKSQGNLNLLDKSMLSQFDAISQYTQYIENNPNEKSEYLQKLTKFKKKINSRKLAK